MRHIFLNLKRFDIPKEYGGVNSIAPIGEWGSFIVSNTQEQLKKYAREEVEFAMYLPEAHLIPAVGALCENSPVKVGCQGVYRDDTAIGGGFGAFTTNRTANAAKAIGCTTTIIGHCEERKDKAGILAEAGVTDTKAVNRLLNQEIKKAVSSGLSVLYCIGEPSEDQERWKEVLKAVLCCTGNMRDSSLTSLEKRVSLSWRYHLRDTLFTCVLLLTVTVYFLFACFYHVSDHNVIGYRNFLLNHA